MIKYAKLSAVCMIFNICTYISAPSDTTITTKKFKIKRDIAKKKNSLRVDY